VRSRRARPDSSRDRPAAGRLASALRDRRQFSLRASQAVAEHSKRDDLRGLALALALPGGERCWMIKSTASILTRRQVAPALPQPRGGSRRKVTCRSATHLSWRISDEGLANINYGAAIGSHNLSAVRLEPRRA
jgi:hypothetical protein